MCANMKLPIVHKPCVHIDSWSTDNCLLRYIVTTAFWPIECTDMYLNDVPHRHSTTDPCDLLVQCRENVSLFVLSV